MKTKYGNFNTRVDFKIAEDFKKIALKLGKKSPDLIRELIIATVENRVKITPANVKYTEVHNNIYT